MVFVIIFLIFTLAVALKYGIGTRIDTKCPLSLFTGTLPTSGASCSSQTAAVVVVKSLAMGSGCLEVGC